MVKAHLFSLCLLLVSVFLLTPLASLAGESCVADDEYSVDLPNAPPYPYSEEIIEDFQCCSGTAYTGGQYFNDHLCTGGFSFFLSNLTAGSITPTTATAGIAVTLSGTVTNNGTISTDAGFYNLFQRATDSSGTGATDIGTYNRTTALTNGSNFAATLSYTFPSAATWYVRVCADKNSAASAGTITESNEGDNCGAWTAVTVSAPSGLVSASPNPCTASTYGGACSSTITITTSNVSAAQVWVSQNGGAESAFTGLLTSGSYPASWIVPGNSYAFRLYDYSSGSRGAQLSSVTVTGNNPSTPNLTAGSITPTTATAGTAVTLSSTVTNNGTGTANPTFYTRFQRATSSGGASATDIGTHTRSSSLANGANFVATLSYTFPSAATWYVRACADQNASGTGTVTESNEGDNCGAWTAVTLSQCSDGVDNDGDTSTDMADPGCSNPGDTTEGGGTFPVAGLCGEITVPIGINCIVAETISLDCAPGERAYYQSAPSTKSCPMNPYSDHQTWGTCIADASCSQPNLTAGSITPTTATAGTAVTLSSTVTNNGTGTANPTFYTRFQRATSSGGASATDIGTHTRSSSLANGANFVATLSYTFPSAATWYVRACADQNASGTGTVTESNEGDNCGAWTAVTVSAACVPDGQLAENNPDTPPYPDAEIDLDDSRCCSGSAVTGASYFNDIMCVGGTGSAPDLIAGSVTPITATVGTAVTLSAVVSNVEITATGAGFTNLFQRATDSNGTSAADIGTYNRTSSLNGGSNFSATLSYTFSSTNGANPWYVRVCADKSSSSSTGSILEVQEANNCGAWTAVTVSAAPQPNLTAGSITPTTATAGTAVTLSSTVTNGGTATTGAGFYNLFQRATDASGTNSTDIGTYNRSTALTNGSNFVATRSYTFPSAATWYVRACADKDAAADAGDITESNEGDNCGIWTAVVVSNPTPECADGADNDFDGFIDYGGADPSCTGVNDTDEDPASPSVGISCTNPTPCTIIPPSGATVTWTSDNADGCTLSGVGSVGANGSTVVYPSTPGTATYAISCTGNGETSPVQQVNVNVLNPYGYITAFPSRIPAASSTLLFFSADQVSTSCSVENAAGTTIWGPTAPSLIPGPIATTSISTGALSYQAVFTLLCDGGVVDEMVIVKIVPRFEEF